MTTAGLGGRSRGPAITRSPLAAAGNGAGVWVNAARSEDSSGRPFGKDFKHDAHTACGIPAHRRNPSGRRPGDTGGLRPGARPAQAVRGARWQRRRDAALDRAHPQGLLPPHGQGGPRLHPRGRRCEDEGRGVRSREDRGVAVDGGRQDLRAARSAVQCFRVRRQRPRDPVRGGERDVALRSRRLRLPQGDAGGSAARGRRPWRTRRRRGGGRRPRRRPG